MDKVTIDRIQLLHPKLRDEATDIYHEICDALKGKAMCRFAYTLRTFAEQDALYALGRTVKNPDGYNAVKKPLGNVVTLAKGGKSYHNYGLAVDIVLIVDKDGNGSFESASWDVKSDFDGDGQSDWMEVVAIFKRHGWTWGGDWTFTDKPHFEKSFGFSVADLQAMDVKQGHKGYLSL